MSKYYIYRVCVCMCVVTTVNQEMIMATIHLKIEINLNNYNGFEDFTLFGLFKIIYWSTNNFDTFFRTLYFSIKINCFPQ